MTDVTRPLGTLKTGVAPDSLHVCHAWTDKNKMVQTRFSDVQNIGGHGDPNTVCDSHASYIVY